MELATVGRVDLGALLEGSLQDAAELLLDGTIATSRAPCGALVVSSRGDGRSAEPRGRVLPTDVSVPIHAIPAFLEETLASLAVSLPDGSPIAYGHVGDGNIHLNVVPPPGWSND